MRKVLCGTPPEHCTGSAFGTSQFLGLKRSVKMHPTNPSAFKCHRDYLIKVEGHVAIGSRELRHPNGGVRVLTKQSRFGDTLRRGKEGGRARPIQGNRGALIRT